jgi:hypothetical protein
MKTHAGGVEIAFPTGVVGEVQSDAYIEAKD